MICLQGWYTDFMFVSLLFWQPSLLSFVFSFLYFFYSFSFSFSLFLMRHLILEHLFGPCNTYSSPLSLLPCFPGDCWLPLQCHVSFAVITMFTFPRVWLDPSHLTHSGCTDRPTLGRWRRPIQVLVSWESFPVHLRTFCASVGDDAAQHATMWVGPPLLGMTSLTDNARFQCHGDSIHLGRWRGTVHCRLRSTIGGWINDTIGEHILFITATR